MAEEDLIFGKNQHFFGGMEPSTMIAFNAVVEDGMIKINAQLPNDTIVNGYSLCTVAGAVIRRRSDDYPVNEFDGDMVADITTSGTFADSTADPTATYFYAAFPYTSQGVYSINAANQCVANGPEPMVEFAVTSEPSKVIITATLPDGAAGAVIRKSTSGYPATETDGNEFMTITSSGTYTDTNVEGGVTYYYAAFPYTASGIYSRDPADRASVTVVTYQYLYGYDLDTTDSDPSTRVTYPSDVDNAGYTPAAMNFSTDVFNYGSWPSIPGEKFMPRPCVLDSNGNVYEYLNPNDYTKNVDGANSKIGGLSATSGGYNCMMEWPKIYTKRWEENGIYHFRCSDMQIDSDWDCWCNYDKNNNQIDHFYTAIYNGNISGNKLRSLSGYTPKGDTTYANFFTYARAHGDDWCIDVLADRLLINDLLVMMGKSTNGQAVYGNGNTGSGSALLNSGSMNTKGLFWGKNTYGSSACGVKVFGMENYWGNQWRFLAGYLGPYGAQYVKITRGTHDGTTVADYSSTGDKTGYINVAGFNGRTGTYITSMKTKPYGRFPYDLNGSATTYECDYVAWQSQTVMIGAAGGCHTEVSAYSGPFAITTNNTDSTANSYTGACLSRKPSKT